MYATYDQYYDNQVGSGIPSFQGVRYQRGHGFFGRLFSGIGSFVKDLAPTLLKRTLPSAIGFAEDLMSGENVGQSAKSRLIEAGKGAANETLDRIKSRIQGGKGLLKIRRAQNRFLRYQPVKRLQNFKLKRRKVNKR